MKLFTYDIPSKQKEGMKALVISDLRYYSLNDSEKLMDIIMEINAQEYDAIFLVGNILDSTFPLNFDRKALDYLLNFMRDLGNVAPTYVALGEHDYTYYDKNKQAIEDKQAFYEKFLYKIAAFSGIKVIDRKTYKIKEGYTLSIINDTNIHEETLNKLEFLRKLPQDMTNTLICHDIKTILELSKLGYLDNMTLSISGDNNISYRQLKVLGRLLDDKERRLDKENKLLINPRITTFGDTEGLLKYVNPLFYRTSSVINYTPEEELTRIKTK